ncbi:MAG TPA: HNH endonuclease [Acetobacteraceae bacterium]|nr:HNH endonuclease [Acetobacteraceae bacterium]
MVQLYVGVTDRDWFDFLSARRTEEGINFWQPGGQTQFKALQPGELFLFKLHSPNNFIVGGGVFAHASILPVSLVWEAFGEANGAPSIAEMKRRIAKYRRQPVAEREDYHIGCRVLEQPFFLPRERWIPVPASWSSNIVSGKRFDTESVDGRTLWDALGDSLTGIADTGSAVETLRYGQPTLVRPRLGQGTFRLAVTDTYERRCAVSQERTLPILDAAHIWGYADGGVHEISNGLLLRTDIHKLFDLGYVTVSTDGRFEVSRPLKEDFQNGKHYYAHHGQQIWQPRDPGRRPSQEALTWHREERYLG